MPRNGSGIYSKPAGTTAVPNTTIESAKFNSVVDDIVQDLNAARPITAGGTGGSTTADAANNLKVVSFGAAQTLSDAEKAQVKRNAGSARETKSGNYTIVADDIGKTIQFTASAVASFQAAATLGSGFSCEIWADDGAVVRFSPNSTETINGVLDMVIQRGQKASVWCDGSALFAKVTSDAQSGPQAQGFIYGLTLANNATDATNDIDIAVGSAAADTSPYNIMTLGSALTKRLDAAWAVGTGNGGRDTGSIADGWWYVFLIRRSDTGVVDALYSLSSTAPTMPSNYDQKRLIGAIFRTSSAIKTFTQFKDYFSWTDPALDFNSTSVSTTGALVTLTVPPIAGTLADMGLGLINDATATLWVREANQTNDTPTTINGDIILDGASATRAAVNISRHVNSSGQVRVRSSDGSVSTFRIETRGFRMAL